MMGQRPHLTLSEALGEARLPCVSFTLRTTCNFLYLAVKAAIFLSVVAFQVLGCSHTWNASWTRWTAPSDWNTCVGSYLNNTGLWLLLDAVLTVVIVRIYTSEKVAEEVGQLLRMRGADISPRCCSLPWHEIALRIFVAAIVIVAGGWLGLYYLQLLDRPALPWSRYFDLWIIGYSDQEQHLARLVWGSAIASFLAASIQTVASVLFFLLTLDLVRSQCRHLRLQTKRCVGSVTARLVTLVRHHHALQHNTCAPLSRRFRSFVLFALLLSLASFVHGATLVVPRLSRLIYGGRCWGRCLVTAHVYLVFGMVFLLVILVFIARLNAECRGRLKAQYANVIHSACTAYSALEHDPDQEEDERLEERPLPPIDPLEGPVSIYSDPLSPPEAGTAQHSLHRPSSMENVLVDVEVPAPRHMSDPSPSPERGPLPVAVPEDMPLLLADQNTPPITTTPLRSSPGDSPKTRDKPVGGVWPFPMMATPARRTGESIVGATPALLPLVASPASPEEQSPPPRCPIAPLAEELPTPPPMDSCIRSHPVQSMSDSQSASVSASVTASASAPSFSFNSWHGHGTAATSRPAEGAASQHGHYKPMPHVAQSAEEIYSAQRWHEGCDMELPQQLYMLEYLTEKMQAPSFDICGLVLGSGAVTSWVLLGLSSIVWGIVSNFVDELV